MDHDERSDIETQIGGLDKDFRMFSLILYISILRIAQEENNRNMVFSRSCRSLLFYSSHPSTI